jgi:hypothetical protein
MSVISAQELLFIAMNFEVPELRDLVHFLVGHDVCVDREEASAH